MTDREIPDRVDLQPLSHMMTSIGEAMETQFYVANGVTEMEVDGLKVRIPNLALIPGRRMKEFKCEFDAKLEGEDVAQRVKVNLHIEYDQEDVWATSEKLGIAAKRRLPGATVNHTAESETEKGECW